MTFARNAERLLILSDIGLGLLNRVHLLLSYRRPPTPFTPDIDKFTKQLLTKRFPDLPTDLPKHSAFDTFRRSADALRSATHDYVATLVDCLGWAGEAWGVLEECGNGVVGFDLGVNVDLTHFYFSLLVRFVQLHLLIAQLDTPQHQILAYYYASYLLVAPATALSTQSNQAIVTPPSALDADYTRLATHLNKYSRQPLKALQSDFTALSLLIGNALCSPSFSNPVYTYSKLKSYTDSKLFNLDTATTTSTSTALLVPCKEAAYAELVGVERVRGYVLYGFLVCPGELQRPGAIELLQQVLQWDVVMPLYRDVVLNVGREYGDLFDTYSKGKFTLKKHKKTFKEATSDSTATLTFHAELRIILQQTATTLLPLFTDAPHALCPQLARVLAFVHVCREEVVWWVRHAGLHGVYGKSVREKERRLFVEDNVSPLLHAAVRLLALIEANKEDIQRYYLSYMEGLDLDQLLTACTALPSSLDPLLAQLLNYICNSLDGRQPTDSFEAVRLNWYRASAGLSSPHVGVPAAVAAKVSAVMNALVSHSRHVDCLDAEVKGQGSFMTLYWYKEEVTALYKRCLSGSQGQPAYALSYVRSLHSALHNVHRLCGEEQGIIGQSIVQTADQWLKLLCTRLEEHADYIGRELHLLRQQAQPTQLIARLGSKSALMPGFESVWDNRRMLGGLRINRVGVSDIMSAVEEEGDTGILCFNVRLFAREYVMDAMSAYLKRRLKQLCFEGSAMQKPTIILNRWHDTLATLHTFERQLSFSLTDLARDVLLQEMAQEDETGIDGADDRPSIHAIAGWYGNIFNRDLAELGIVHSPLHNCFLTRPGYQPPSSAAQHFVADFQRYTDANSLVALVTLCGPAGVRIIFAMLMKIVAGKLKLMKDVLTANMAIAKSAARRFSDGSVLAEVLGQLKDMDTLVALTTSVGAILHFRLLLTRALSVVAGEHVEWMGATLQLASDVAHSSTRCDPTLTVLDLLSADCGVELHEADHLFRHIVSKLKTTVADVALFSLLPELYALSLSCSRWRQSSYLIDLQAYTTNLHCQALAIRHLLVDLNRVGVTASKESETTINERIQNDFDRWLACSAAVLLHIYQPSTNIGLNSGAGLLGMRDKGVGREEVSVVNARLGVDVGGVSSALMWCEVCVRESEGRLTYGALERCMPYTLLRENYSQLDEKQNPQIVSVGGVVVEDEKE